MKKLETIVLPQDTANDDEVKINNIYVKQSEHVKPNHCCLDYETSKATFEVSSKIEGYIKLLCKEGDIKKIGDKVLEIYDSPIKDDIKDQNSNSDESQGPIFSKNALRKIKESNLDKELFKKYDLVTEKIVNDLLEDNNLHNEIKNVNKIIKINPTKKNEIINLSNNQRFGLVSRISKTINCDNLDLETIYKNKEFKGSLALVLLEAVTEIISKEQFVHLNSYCDGSSIFNYKNVDFGVALNMGQGLKVGVIRDLVGKKINYIEDKFLYLIDKYIDGKLSIDDVSDPTVILTDLSESEIDNFTPLISKNNTIMIGLSGQKSRLQTLTIAFDHRVTDGLEVSNFINSILDYILQKYQISIDLQCFKCMKTLDEDKDLDGPGFLVVINKNNKQHICKNCLLGW